MKIKDKIKKLRQDAENKIAEANFLENSIPKGEKNKVVGNLYKRFAKLEAGFNISEWSPKTQFEVPKITTAVFWYSDQEPEFEQDIDVQIDDALDHYRYALHQEWEEWIEKHPRVFQMKREIKSLCDESDRQAKKFVVNKGDFWEMVMTGECE